MPNSNILFQRYLMAKSKFQEKGFVMPGAHALEDVASLYDISLGEAAAIVAQEMATNNYEGDILQ